MLIIAERVNASNKLVAQALRERDVAFFRKLVSDQAAAGADYLDVNAGRGTGATEQECADMEWLIKTIREVTAKPLVIDSADPKVIETGLKKCIDHTPIVNSINAESKKLEALAPLVAEYDAEVIVLAMDEGGIPSEVEGRLRACDKVVEKLNQYSPPPRPLFDPLVLPIGVGTEQGMVTLKTLEQLKLRYPEARTTLGLSNISHGLPLRGIINRAFLLMAIYAGLDSVIMDVLDKKLLSFIKVGEMLVSRDPFCKEYLTAYRKGTLRE
jgi:5-methyltetrahydrofolate--homocysteine methyltransferase